MLNIKIDEKDFLNLRDSLKAITLPKNKRFKILKQLSRWEIKHVRKRINSQKDINNKSIAPRKKDNKKALRKMSQGMEGYVKNSATMVEITWKSRGQARLAAKHHEGYTEKITANVMAKRFPVKYDAPCTKRQALKLRKLNYQIKYKTKKGAVKYKKPATRYLMESLTNGQAGLLIRTLENIQSKSSWDLTLPKRQILGTEQHLVTDELLRLLQQERER